MTKESKPRYPLNDVEKKWLKALSSCTFLPASPDKRFVRDMQGATEMTAGQLCYLSRMVFRYRRQLRMSDDYARVLKVDMEAFITDRGVVIPPNRKEQAWNAEHQEALKKWNAAAREFSHGK